MFNDPVTLTPDKKDGGFVATFMDIPEAITQGDTVAQALAAGSISIFLLPNARGVAILLNVNTDSART